MKVGEFHQSPFQCDFLFEKHFLISIACYIIKIHIIGPLPSILFYLKHISTEFPNMKQKEILKTSWTKILDRLDIEELIIEEETREALTINCLQLIISFILSVKSQIKNKQMSAVKFHFIFIGIVLKTRTENTAKLYNICSDNLYDLCRIRRFYNDCTKFFGLVSDNLNALVEPFDFFKFRKFLSP